MNELNKERTEINKTDQGTKKDEYMHGRIQKPEFDLEWSGVGGVGGGGTKLCMCTCLITQRKTAM